MRRLQAFKYELNPNGDQHRQMRRFAGSCRFVFNAALALQKQRHDQGEKKLGYAGLCRQLTEWRHDADTAWLADAPVHPLQQALKDLERAYSNFFARRAEFPRFRKKGRHERFRYPDPKQFRLDEGNSRIFLPKLRVRKAALELAVAGASETDADRLGVAIARDRGRAVAPEAVLDRWLNERGRRVMSIVTESQFVGTAHVPSALHPAPPELAAEFDELELRVWRWRTEIEAGDPAGAAFRELLGGGLPWEADYVPRRIGVQVVPGACPANSPAEGPIDPAGGGVRTACKEIGNPS